MMQKRYTRLHVVNYFTVLCLLGCMFFSPSVLRAQLSVAVNSGGVTSVATGQDICFDVSYTWSSTTQDLNGAKIEVPIPLPLVGDAINDVGIFNSPHIASSAYNPATRIITWTMIDPLPAGSSGTVKFCVHFANGSTTNGASVTITPTFSGTGQIPASSTSTLTATAAPKATLAKSLRTDPALDNEATYTATVNNNQGNGNYNLTNVVITDQLPAGAIFISATSGGTESGGVVTWNIASLPIGTTTYLKVKVKYPSGTFNLGDMVTNNVSMTGTSPEGAIPGVTASKTNTIAAPNPLANIGKYSWTDWMSVNGNTGYSIYHNNEGNVPLTNVILEEVLPAEFEVTGGALPIDYNGTTNHATLEYQTTSNGTWTAWPGSPFTLMGPNATYFNTSTLGLASGEYLTKIRVTYDELAVNYEGSTLQFYGKTINADVNGVTYTYPHVINNTINYEYTGGGQTKTGTQTDPATILDVSPKPYVDKSLASSYYQQPTNTVTYNFRLYNRWEASDSLKQPYLADLLPPDVTIDTTSFSNLSGPIGAPTLTVIDNFNGTGRQLLKFNWTSSLAVGGDQYWSMDAKIKAGASPGDRKNQLMFMSSNNPILNICDNPQYISDTFDIDGDGLTLTDTLPTSNNATFNIIETTAIQALKLVKGACDTVFHKFPSVGKTTQNGLFQYRLTVTNIGNQPLTKIKIMDILPWVGDVGVITHTTNRDSKYDPTFVSIDTMPAGITVMYSNSQNPCRADLDPAIAEASGCTGSTFSSTPIADPQSLMFDFGTIVIQPADSLVLYWTMRAPYGVAPNDVAWNSFGHRSESTTGTLVPPAEPIKVGVTVKSAKIGDLVWLDTNKDGIFNNGETGIQGVTIHLLDASMNPVINPVTNQPITTTSDASGNYFFNVEPGTFFVKFDLPSGYATSSANQGGDDATDSDIDNSGKTTTSITVVDGDVDLKWDAGIYQVCPVAPSISSITVDTATCTSGVANSDAKITIDGIAVATTYSYSAVSASNLFFSNATAISGSTISLTGLPNPSVPTTYYFRIYASDSLCYKDTSVVLNPSVCVVFCTSPTIAGVSADTATCNAGVANSDAALHVTGITGMAKYAYGTNGTTGLFAATATASTAASINITGLANPATTTTYTFRIYAADSTCYNDTTIVLTPSVCVVATTVDLALTKTVNNATTTQGSNVVFTIKVKNEGTGAATGVTVHDSLPVGMTFISATPSGVYDANTKLWTIGNIAAGDSVTLATTVRIDSVGVNYNSAEVHALNETDTDSSPNNGVTTEDDIDRVCVSVPVPLCTAQGKTLALTIPSGYTNIKWFKDNVEIAGQTSNTLTVSAIGNYTFTANESTCPVEGCCPVMVVEGNCDPVCKPIICLPVTVTRAN